MELKNMLEQPPEEVQRPIYDEDLRPAYPCGLSISLDDDGLKKLGITDLPAINSTMTLEAKVIVTRIADDTGFYGRHRCLGLQITDMALSAPVEGSAPAASEGGEY